MERIILVFCLTICIINANVSRGKSNFHQDIQDFDKQWEEFKLKFHKTYATSKEEAKRRSIWESNLASVIQHNKEHLLGLHSYSNAINQFSDLTTEEVIQQYTGLKTSMEPQGENYHRVSNKTLPDSVDWRTKGYVTYVKYQGGCGCCYAFAATGALEGQYFRFQKTLVSFSEQQDVDCNPYNGGCHGGIVFSSYRYLMKKGVENDIVYPYKHKVGKCSYNASKVVVKLSGYKYVKGGDENALKDAIAFVGPVTSTINISGISGIHYHSGVYDNPNCTRYANHGVLVVGYGRENGKDYWLVKNSWGVSWADHGYFKIIRNKHNQCEIGYNSSYPLLAGFD